GALRIGLLADVAAHEAAAELARDARTAVFLQVGDDDGRAVRGEHARRAFAEPGRTAGDDENLALADVHLESPSGERRERPRGDVLDRSGALDPAVCRRVGVAR